MANSDTGETQTQQLDKLFSDFISDLKTTYPEYDTQFKLLYNDEKLNMDLILNHCQNVYPERFFDILYKNEDIFSVSLMESEPETFISSIYKSFPPPLTNLNLNLKVF